MTYSENRSAASWLRAKATHGILALLAAASLSGAAAAAQAGDPPAANQDQAQAAQAAASKSAKPDPEDRVTCRQEEEIGTRLGGKRVCHTQREWKQIARDGQDMLNSNGHQASPPGK